MTDVSYIELETGLFRIDTQLYRSDHTAAYLLRHGDELAFFDSGGANSVPGLLEATRRIGLGPEAVRYVMPTHVHLDHAGGAGALMAACENAQLVTHHKGAPHMVDPTRLQAGAMSVYGEEEFKRLYGILKGIDSERVTAAYEGDRFPLGDGEILHIETRGHANHHGCFFDTLSGNIFTGDTFGLSYREFDSGPDNQEPWLIATTTPIDFDPDAWMDSLDRMLALKPKAACVTHFGQLMDPQKLAPALRANILAHRDIALALEADQSLTADSADFGTRLHAEVDALLVDEACRRRPEMNPAEARELLQLDIDLNAQGLHVWIKRRAKQQDRT